MRWEKNSILWYWNFSELKPKPNTKSSCDYECKLYPYSLRYTVTLWDVNDHILKGSV